MGDMAFGRNFGPDMSTCQPVSLYGVYVARHERPQSQQIPVCGSTPYPSWTPPVPRDHTRGTIGWDAESRGTIS